MKRADAFHFNLYIEPIIMRKIRYIAKYLGRSGNKFICNLLKNAVNTFERKYGEISEEDLKTVGLIKLKE